MVITSQLRRDTSLVILVKDTERLWILVNCYSIFQDISLISFKFAQNSTFSFLLSAYISLCPSTLKMHSGVLIIFGTIRRGEEMRPDFSEEQHVINLLGCFEGCLACNSVKIIRKELCCKMLNICSIYMDYMISKGAFNLIYSWYYLICIKLSTKI